MDKFALIIPAAGSGSRLNTETPKPFIEIAGKTILEHTLSKFFILERLSKIIVATSSGYLEKVEELISDDIPQGKTLKVIEGGSERQHSIYNALQHIGNCEYVIVHDAVRPFVKEEHIEQCCNTASEMGASVLGVKAKDTIKRTSENDLIEETPSRSNLWQAQTPQTFKSSILVEAYEAARKDNFVGTDDASLVERLGYPVKMVEGDRMNFKITYPLDLKLARQLFEEN
ncbi:MAG: 2-C-methyl-D-erythritol 4-phosphate cytidylyltransferase [Balneolaceae bacterium]|nr:2-C-methyl-D-erythritol 4-phosphate cytidylyltransferase [Balneolaceae bacterium]